MRWTTFACFIAHRHKGTSHSPDSVTAGRIIGGERQVSGFRIDLFAGQPEQSQIFKFWSPNPFGWTSLCEQLLKFFSFVGVGERRVNSFAVDECPHLGEDSRAGHGGRGSDITITTIFGECSSSSRLSIELFWA